MMSRVAYSPIDLIRGIAIPVRYVKSTLSYVYCWEPLKISQLDDRVIEFRIASTNRGQEFSQRKKPWFRRSRIESHLAEHTLAIKLCIGVRHRLQVYRTRDARQYAV